MSVTTGVASLVAYRHLAQTSGAMTTSLKRLSSGYRINSAADDAAGLAISEGLRSQIGGMTQAVRNAQDGVSVVQTAEGALNETSAVLRRMRDLAVQGANDGALNTDGKADIQKEMDQLGKELDRIAGTTTFDGIRLLDGTYDRVFQVGADAGDTIRVVIGSATQTLTSSGLGLSSIDVTTSSSTVRLSATVTPAVSADQGGPSAGRLSLAGDFSTPAAFQGLVGTIAYNGRTFDLGSVDYTGAVTAQNYLDKLNFAAAPALGMSTYPFGSTSGELVFGGDTPGPASTVADAVALTPAYTGKTVAGGAVTTIDTAISRVSSTRADLGAVQNRLEHTIDRLRVSIEDTTASESRIRDTDNAQETAAVARSQVLTQAGTAMLAQAGQSARTILKLLG